MNAPQSAVSAPVLEGEVISPKRNRTTFQKGQSGNPGGKPKNARNRVTVAFLECLADDFAKHGKKALEQMRKEAPAKYIAAIVQLCPKQVEVERPLESMSDDELRDFIADIRRVHQEGGGGAGAGAIGGGAAAAGGREPAAALPAVHEAA